LPDAFAGAVDTELRGINSIFAACDISLSFVACPSAANLGSQDRRSRRETET
jgi:hypothetical protein